MREECGKLLEKASRAIRAAETLLREGESEFAAGRAYYAMFYTASALLAARGYDFVSIAGSMLLTERNLLRRRNSVPSFIAG